MAIEEIKTIRSAIREKDYQWSAGLTSISKLPEEERKKYLGLVIEKEEIERMAATLEEEDALAASEGIAGYITHKMKEKPKEDVTQSTQIGA